MAAIPPDPEAVRQAMAAPERGKRGQMLLGLGLVVALAVIVVQASSDDEDSRPTDPSTAAVVDPTQQRYVEPFNHPTGFRFFMPLAPGRLGRRTEFEGLLTFGYTVYRSDVEDAKASIEDNWDQAAKQIGQYVGSFDKLALVDQLEAVNEKIKKRLSATLFPDGIAQVQTVNWREMKFR